MNSQVLKKCAACRAEKPVSEMKTCMHNQMHNYVCDSKCMNDFYNPPKTTPAPIPDAVEGVEVPPYQLHMNDRVTVIRDQQGKWVAELIAWDPDGLDAMLRATSVSALRDGGGGEPVAHSAQWPTIPGLSQKPKEVAAWLHEWRAGNAGGIVVSLAQMSLEGLRRSRGEHAHIVSSDPLYKGDEAAIGLQHEVIAEHSGCGYGCQVDQITVRLFRGDKVLIVRAPSLSKLETTTKAAGVE